MDNPVDPYEASFKGSTFWGKPYAESDNIYIPDLFFYIFVISYIYIII